MATTVAELGQVYCSVLSFANIRSSDEMEKGEVVQSLIAIRLKLKRSLAMRTNIVYEVSHLRTSHDRILMNLRTFAPSYPRWPLRTAIVDRRLPGVTFVVLVEGEMAIGTISEDSGDTTVSWFRPASVLMPVLT